jgi:hypothetical protein
VTALHTGGSTGEQVTYISSEEGLPGDDSELRIAVFDNSGKVAGSMRMLPSGDFTVFDREGMQFRTPDGTPLTFTSVDQASGFIHGQRRSGK